MTPLARNAALLLLAGSVFGPACRAERAAPSPEPPDASDAQRVVALLDYVSSDYAIAVRDGRVASEAEYREQVAFVADARRLAEEVAARRGLAAREEFAALRVSLAGLETAVHAVAPPETVARTARVARDRAVAAFGLRTRPNAPPSLERARALYAETCATCHGPTGDGDTERARTLDPAPARFRDPDRRAALSPYRVYNTLTFGVPGTAMASFADALPPADRWALAFYVLRLGHEGSPRHEVHPLPLGELAERNDTELVETLQASGERDPWSAVAWLRIEAPFRAAEEGVDAARIRLREAMAAAAAGRVSDADRIVLDAYLQDFEPVEPRLRARDAAVTAEIEREFMELRGALSRGDVALARDRHAALDGALAGISGSGGRVVPFFAALFIYLREGVEAALLVGALLAGVRRLGRGDATRWVHAGWIAALPAGLATWWAADHLLRLTARDRELMEAVVGLLAAAVLFSVSFWMISRAESRHWMAYLRRTVEQTVSQQRLLLLAGVSFLAVYREAAETVLFTQALLLDARGEEAGVWAGAATGFALVVVLGGLLSRVVRRLPVGPFFAVSGVLLCVLAVSFAGSGLHALVAGGYLRPRPVAFPDIPWLGVHPDLNALVVQLVIVLVVAGAAVATLLRRHADTP